MNFYVIASAVDYAVSAGDPLITGNQFKGMKLKGINDNHFGDILINLQRFHISY